MGMANLLVHELRRGIRSLFRAPAFAAAAMLSLALGAGLGAGVLALFRLESLAPPRLGSAIELDPVRESDWGVPWGRPPVTPAELQREALNGLLLILGAVALLALAIACANLLILLLSRASARRREMAIRSALGAPRRGFLMHWLGEGALLACAGGALALLVAAGGVGALGLTWPEGLRPWPSPEAVSGLALLALGTPTVQLDLPEPGEANEARRAALYATLLERVHAVSPGFFGALGIPVLQGREFRAGDRVDAPRVAVINRAYSVEFAKGEPVGRRVQIGGPRGHWYTIVGVVGDIHARGIGAGSDPAPALYLSALQHPPRSAGLAVRTAGDPLRLAPAVRRILYEVDPGLAAYEIETLERHLAEFAAPLRWLGWIFAGLAAAALLLATHGLYSVMAYHVSRRRREIGTRMALGARGRSIVAMVIGQSLRLAWLGGLLGLFGAVAIARLLQLHFPGVPLFDPALFGSILALLAGAALLGSSLPAAHAARVDPGVSLQAE